MSEKFYEHDIDVRILFINFKQAFDSIRRGELYEVMLRTGIPIMIMKLVQMAVDSTSAKIKVEKKLSEPFQFNTGVKQGDGLSTTLLKIALHSVINKTDQKGTHFLSVARSVLTWMTDCY
jgi:hypothetical protein